jgi:general secretion pathway protein F
MVARGRGLGHARGRPRAPRRLHGGQAKLKGKVVGRPRLPGASWRVDRHVAHPRVLMVAVVPKVSAIFETSGQAAALVHPAAHLHLARRWAATGGCSRWPRRRGLALPRWKATPAGRLNWDGFRSAPVSSASSLAWSPSRASRAPWRRSSPAGVPLLKAMEIVKGVLENRCSRRSSPRRSDHPRGREHRRAAQALGALPAHRDAHDRDRRALGRARGHAGGRERELRQRRRDRVAVLTSLLEPLMIVVMGGAVGPSSPSPSSCPSSR